MVAASSKFELAPQDKILQNKIDQMFRQFKECGQINPEPEPDASDDQEVQRHVRPRLLDRDMEQQALDDEAELALAEEEVLRERAQLQQDKAEEEARLRQRARLLEEQQQHQEQQQAAEAERLRQRARLMDEAERMRQQQQQQQQRAARMLLPIEAPQRAAAVAAAAAAAAQQQQQRLQQHYELLQQQTAVGGSQMYEPSTAEGLSGRWLCADRC